MKRLSKTPACLVAASVAAAAMAMAPTADAANAAGSDAQAQAQLLMSRAKASYHKAQLGLALLQHSQAERLHPATAQGSTFSATLAAAAQAEAQLLEKGLVAAQARDLATVQQVVRELRVLDRNSSAALELVLRYQAALADYGGAFPRARWADFQFSTKKD
jgi:hypothetical protein